MLTIFRKDQPIGYIFLLLYCFLFRLPIFFLESNWAPTKVMQFSSLVYTSISFDSMWVKFLSVMLVYIQAVLICIFCNQNSIVRENSLFPGVFYITIISIFPEFNSFSPILIGNLFLILAIGNLLACYKVHKNNGIVFNAGIFIGMASLCYLSFVVFLVAVFIGFLRMKSFKLHERIQYIIGFLIPFFLVGTYFYWLVGLGHFWQYFTESVGIIDLYFNNTWITYAKFGILAFLLLFVVLKIPTIAHKNSVQGLRKIQWLVICLFFPTLCIFFQGHILFENFLIFLVPLSILLGLEIQAIKNFQIAEVVHLLLICISFLFQYII